ncbi:hypothetical protein Tco_1335465 [Tanacetum coccineum]
MIIVIFRILGVANNMKKPSQAPKGFSVGSKMGFKPAKEYRPVSKKPTANTSGNKKNDVEPIKQETSNLVSKESNSSGSSFWNVESSSMSTTPIVEKIGNIEKLIMDGKVTLVDDQGVPVKKEKGGFGTTSFFFFERQIEINKKTSKKLENYKDMDLGHFIQEIQSILFFLFGTTSLLEQRRDSYENGDYDYDPYDDDMYEGQKIPDKLQAICDNLDIKVQGRKKK